MTRIRFFGWWRLKVPKRDMPDDIISCLIAEHGRRTAQYVTDAIWRALCEGDQISATRWDAIARALPGRGLEPKQAYRRANLSVPRLLP